MSKSNKSRWVVMEHYWQYNKMSAIVRKHLVARAVSDGVRIGGCRQPRAGWHQFLRSFMKVNLVKREVHNHIVREIRQEIDRRNSWLWHGLCWVGRREEKIVEQRDCV